MGGRTTDKIVTDVDTDEQGTQRHTPTRADWGKECLRIGGGVSSQWGLSGAALQPQDPRLQV